MAEQNKKQLLTSLKHDQTTGSGTLIYLSI